MARGRMISKSLSTSEKRAKLHDTAGRMAEFCQALYPLIVAHADDWGRLDGSTFHIKYAVDPTSPRPEKDFGKALGFLVEVGLIDWYRAEGREVVQVKDFERHQTGLHKRTDAASRKFPENPGNSSLNEQNRTEPKRTEGKGTEPADALSRLWNEGTSADFPKVLELTDKRRKAAAARLAERTILEWGQIISQIDRSDFCRGANDRAWRADFDWLLRPDTAAKVLEGKYDNRAPKAKAQPTPVMDFSWEDECQRTCKERCQTAYQHAMRKPVAS
jgi:hypothetical protein